MSEISDSLQTAGAELKAAGIVDVVGPLEGAARNMERARVYNRIITILNRERDRAKGRGARAVKKRAEIRELIEWLSNDPAWYDEKSPFTRGPPT